MLVDTGSTPSNLLDDLTGGDEDDLGYYTDGVKRTLTDDQIAMFRHSEVQSLLREQRHDKEREKSEFKDVPRSKELEDGVWGVHELEDDQDLEAEDNAEDEDDEEEYARFLAAEQEEMKLIASRQKRQDPYDHRTNIGKISTRRTVREMDAMTSNINALDYGDEPESEVNSLDTVEIPYGYRQHADGSSHEQQNELVNGRKIWWPAIQT